MACRRTSDPYHCNPDTFLDTDAKLRLAQHHHTADSGVTRRPVEPGPLSEAEFTVGLADGGLADGDYTARWEYTKCAEDHFVDGDGLLAFTTPDPLPHYARAWAYTEIESTRPGPATLVLTTYGPADVWLNGGSENAVSENGSLCCQHTAFGFQQVAFTVDLAEGLNALLVRFEQVAAGADQLPHAIALRMTETPGDVHVQIPTIMSDVNYRNRLERVFDTAYLDRDVFVWDERVTVHWAESQNIPEEIMIRLQTPSGRIYAESLATATPGDKWPLVEAHQAPQGPLRCILMPRTKQYYDDNVRIRRMFSLWGLGLAQYNETPEGTFATRRMDALQHAVRCEGDVFGEIAKMALGMWNVVGTPVLLRHIERINRHAADSALHLLGLLGMSYRWSDAPEFPKTLQAPLRSCLLNFTYDQHLDAASESEQLLLHTCEILAGQLYPKRKFKRSGQTGEWHVAQGKRRAMAWLRARALGGFAEWDSGPAFEASSTALAHLMDLVENEALWEMTTVVMDKLLFTLALNSFHGVLGGTQGCADAASVLDGRLSPTGGVTRLLWGVGILNQHLAGAVSLACMETTNCRRCSRKSRWRPRMNCGTASGTS